MLYKKWFAVLLTLCLVISLMPVTAQAEGAVYIIREGETWEEVAAGEYVENHGTVITNNGTVIENYGTVTNNKGTVTENFNTGTVTNNYDTVSDNKGTVTYNYGTVTHNYKDVTYNKSGSIIIMNCSDGFVYGNDGTVTENEGTIDFNRGTVNTNNNFAVINTNRGSVDLNKGTIGTNGDNYGDGIVGNNNGTVEVNNYLVSRNYGTVVTNASSGIVKNHSTGIVTTNKGKVYNYGGTVTNKSTGTEYFLVLVLDSNHASVSSTGLESAYDDLWIAEVGGVQTTATLTITPPEGYEINSIPNLPTNVTASKDADGIWTLTITSGIPTTTIRIPEATAIQYTVTVNGGTGGGSFAAGDSVTVTANAPEANKRFKEWTATGITLTDAQKKATRFTFTMPGNDVTLTATYESFADGYYLIGQNGWTVDTLDPAQVFTVNPENANEYMLETTLAVGDTIKVVRVADGAIAQWYPDPGDNYTVDAAHAGSVTIYFKTTYDSAWSAFGGHIWIEKKVPKFATHSLVLDGKIGVNFFMDLRPLTDEERIGTYMTFTVSGAGGVSEEPVYFDASQMNSDALYHKFACYVSSIQMADTITATYHWFEDGVEKTVSEDYSVKQYISAFNAKKESFDETTVALVRALADYGHYVQAFLAVQNGLALGTDYAEMDLHYANEYDISAVSSAVGNMAIVRNNNTGGDVENILYTLRLDSDVTIEVYFKLASGYNGKFTVTSDDGSYTVTESGRQRIVKIANIPAHKLGETYTFDVETDHGTARVAVSALSYVKSMLDAYTDAPARNAAAAIYAYAAAADAFMAAH